MKQLVLLILLFANVNLFSQSTENLSRAPEHGLLQMFEGKWRILFKAANGLEEANFGSGDAKGSLILKDRFAEINTNITINGFKTIGKILIGFNPGAKLFYLIGIDNQSPASLYAEGVIDKSKKTFILFGESNFDRDKPAVKFKITIDFSENGKFIYSLFSLIDDKEKLVTETHYVKLDD